jgi:hypothetical protein
MSFVENIKYSIKSFSNIHIQGKKKNIFLFATARSGSTWLMEIIASNPGIKYYDEPFNIRRPNVKKYGRFKYWSELMPDSDNKEAIFDYLYKLTNNNIKFVNPAPFRKNHSFISERIIFKIHELEHLINEIAEEFNGKVVFLIRHPIATSLSRKVFPRLEQFRKSKVYNEKYLGMEKVEEIERLLDRGSKLQKGIVSWCYQNIIPLKFAENSDWLFITYEELVLNPLLCCKLFIEELDLDSIKAMMKCVNEAAANIKLSDKETIDLFKVKNNSKRKLKIIQKWKKYVKEEEEKKLFEILDIFGLDIYIPKRIIAIEKYLHFESTSKIVNYKQ